MFADQCASAKRRGREKFPASSGFYKYSRLRRWRPPGSVIPPTEHFGYNPFRYRANRAGRAPVPGAIILLELCEYFHGSAEVNFAMSGVKNDTTVLSVPSTSTNLGRLERRVQDECRSVVIEERGTAKAVLVSIRDYVRLAAPEPEVLTVIGQESQRKGTDKLTFRQIDEAIKAARTPKPKRG